MSNKARETPETTLKTRDELFSPKTVVMWNINLLLKEHIYKSLQLICPALSG